MKQWFSCIYMLWFFWGNMGFLGTACGGISDKQVLVSIEIGEGFKRWVLELWFSPSFAG